MKRFLLVAAILSAIVLAFWAFFQTPLSSTSKAQSANMPDQEHILKDDALSSVQSKGEIIPLVNVKVAPVFDNTGKVVSDPTGTLLKENLQGGMVIPVTGAAVKVAPVFDNTGKVVSDPTGTLVNMNHPGEMVVPVTGGAVKVAPVFDNTGKVVSDPTGTLLSVIKP